MSIVKQLSSQSEAYLKDVASILERTSSDQIARIAEILLDAYRRGATVFTAGNG